MTPAETDDKRPAPLPHGGDLKRAIARFGGAREAWLDLSTGINAEPWPLDAATAPPEIWRRLPDDGLAGDARDAARAAYGAPDDAGIALCAGAQAAIQALPRVLGPPSEAAILTPAYAEHARAFAAAGWRLRPIAEPEQAAGAAAAVIVNPNNPDGRRWPASALLALSDRVGALVVDESFMDATPEASLAPEANRAGLIVLRSLGKFYGLAGLRFGAAIAASETAERLAAELGPWPVSGPALYFGAAALRDARWAQETRRRLAATGPRLTALGRAGGLAPVGGAGLFQTFAAPDAAETQAQLARRRIWSRVFEARGDWIRLGAPGPEADWARLERALRELALAETAP